MGGNYIKKLKKKICFYWAVVLKCIHLLLDDQWTPFFPPYSLLIYPVQKETFSVTHLFIFQGRLSENKCNYSESESLKKKNRHEKVFHISCMYSGLLLGFKVRNRNLPSFLTLYYSNRESTLTSSESVESGIRPVCEQVHLQGVSAVRHKVPRAIA